MLCLLAVLGVTVALLSSITGGVRRADAGDHRAPPREHVDRAPRAAQPDERVPSRPIELARTALPPSPDGVRDDDAPGEWPPARAFTARCRAPDGGCEKECTTLAGGRCLDPCFIHTAECSNDCRRPDGTCGWPPPDTE